MLEFNLKAGAFIGILHLQDRTSKGRVMKIRNFEVIERKTKGYSLTFILKGRR